MKLYGFYNKTGTIPGFACPVFVNEFGTYLLQDCTDIYIRNFSPADERELEPENIIPVHAARDLSGIAEQPFNINAEAVLAVQTDDATLLFGCCDDILPLLFRYRMEQYGEGLPDEDFAHSAGRLWNHFYKIKCSYNTAPATGSSPNAAKAELEELVTDMLQAIGFPCHTKGYSYLQDAVFMVAGDPTLVQGVTTKLYPKIAERHKTIASRVERNIRHALITVWKQGDTERLAQYFEGTAPGMCDRPSNSVAITALATRVRLKQKRRA